MDRTPMSKVRAFVFVLLLTFASGVGAGLDCIRFLPVGVCAWLLCLPGFCAVAITPKFGHFNPDLLVHVNNPQGVNRVEDPQRIDTHNRNHQNLIYRDVIAVGHPLAGLIYCPSQATALFPYFISELDVLGWRFGIPDVLHPASYIPGLEEIGHWPLNRWGSVYPRTGWVIQSDEPKAAAVVAQRAGDFITRLFEPHIYYPLTGLPIFGLGPKLTFPPFFGLIENSNLGGDWQLNQLLEPGCLVFGKNDLLRFTSWGGGKVEADGDYTFTLWRPYTCCEILGEALLFFADFIFYPLPDTVIEGTF